MTAISAWKKKEEKKKKKEKEKNTEKRVGGMGKSSSQVF